MKPHIASGIAQERLRQVVLAQRPISRRRNRAKVGKKLQVLLESTSARAGYNWIGRSQADAPDVDGLVYVQGGRNLKPGRFITAHIERADTYDLFGSVAPMRD